VAGPLGQMLRCRVTAGEVTDMPERSAARGGVDIDLLQGGPVVRIRLPPAKSLLRTVPAVGFDGARLAPSLNLPTSPDPLMGWARHVDSTWRRQETSAWQRSRL
jgi:hypothetical protein